MEARTLLVVGGGGILIVGAIAALILRSPGAPSSAGSAGETPSASVGASQPGLPSPWSEVAPSPAPQGSGAPGASPVPVITAAHQVDMPPGLSRSQPPPKPCQVGTYFDDAGIRRQRRCN